MSLLLLLLPLELLSLASPPKSALPEETDGGGLPRLLRPRPWFSGAGATRAPRAAMETPPLSRRRPDSLSTSSPGAGGFTVSPAVSDEHALSACPYSSHLAHSETKSRRFHGAVLLLPVGPSGCSASGGHEFRRHFRCHRCHRCYRRRCCRRCCRRRYPLLLLRPPLPVPAAAADLHLGRLHGHGPAASRPAPASLARDVCSCSGGRAAAAPPPLLGVGWSTSCRPCG